LWTLATVERPEDMATGNSNTEKASDVPELATATAKDTPYPAVTTADDRRVEVLKEYSTYVATQPITAPSGARAFNPGDPVPISHVEGPFGTDGKRDASRRVEWVQEDQYAKRGTVEARAAMLAAGGIGEDS
jgi:hypothetical protein